MINAYFDASISFNPGGYIQYGYWFNDVKGIGYRFQAKENTVNVAEALGAKYLLLKLIEMGLTNEPIIVRGDSRIIINKLNGKGKIKNKTRHLLFAQICLESIELSKRFRDIKFFWIPREYNGVADALTHELIVID